MHCYCRATLLPQFFLGTCKQQGYLLYQYLTVLRIMFMYLLAVSLVRHEGSNWFVSSEARHTGVAWGKVMCALKWVEIQYTDLFLAQVTAAIPLNDVLNLVPVLTVQLLFMICINIDSFCHLMQILAHLNTYFCNLNSIAYLMFLTLHKLT